MISIFSLYLFYYFADSVFPWVLSILISIPWFKWHASLFTLNLHWSKSLPSYNSNFLSMELIFFIRTSSFIIFLFCWVFLHGIVRYVDCLHDVFIALYLMPKLLHLFNRFCVSFISSVPFSMFTFIISKYDDGSLYNIPVFNKHRRFLFVALFYKRVTFEKQ